MCVCVCVCVCMCDSVGCCNTITSAEVRRRFGVEEILKDVVVPKRLRWLGHVARVDDSRLPKRLLFGWLPQRDLPTEPSSDGGTE